MIQNHPDIVTTLVHQHNKQIERDAAAARAAARRPRRWFVRRREAAAVPTAAATSNARPTKAPQPAVSFR